MKCPHCDSEVAFIGHAGHGKEAYWCPYCGTLIYNRPVNE